MKALGGKYELAQGDYFGCGAVGWRNLGHGAAGLGAELPDLSLHGRYAVYRRFLRLRYARLFANRRQTGDACQASGAVGLALFGGWGDAEDHQGRHDGEA